MIFYEIKLKKLKEQIISTIKTEREDAIKKSRAVIEGNIAEQLAPILPGWKYTPSDCKFISAPVDYIIFNGLSENQVSEVVILEVKKDSSHPTKRQNSIKKAIEDGNVRYELYRIKNNKGVITTEGTLNEE